MTNVKSPWDVKYLREQPFMAFGSMMNAYSTINQGKGITFNEFKETSSKIFELAREFTSKSFDGVTKEDSVDIPIKLSKPKLE